MSLVDVSDFDFWVPMIPAGYLRTAVRTVTNALLLDSDEEEVQCVGEVSIVGGGTKTLGGGSSALSWLPGTPITFASGSTVRVGVKKASSLDLTAGPPARATLGAGAFDVYRDLVGGTHTITAATWRTDALSSGTPYSVADNDPLALCWHLDSTSGTPAVRVQTVQPPSALGFPSATLVTSGPTYTDLASLPNVVLTFADGTLGWLHCATPYATIDANTATIGNGNIVANLLTLPLTVEVDAVAAMVQPTTNAGNFALDMYSTPLETPGLMATAAQDANLAGAANAMRLYRHPLTPSVVLQANTAYAVGIRQTTGTAVVATQYDVAHADHFKAGMGGPGCVAVNSTAGGTFVTQASGLRRYHIWARIRAIDVGGGGGRPLVPGRRGIGVA